MIPAMSIFEIDGSNFDSLEGFYDELGRALIPEGGWARNLDALDDMLSGGWGTPNGGFTLRWLNHDLSRQRLGYDETVRQLEKRLERCHPSNREKVRADLEAARRGEGETAFDWLVGIIRYHGPGGDESDDGVVLELA